ncbi:dual specificity protein phosphatase 13B-like [Syngnathoides biaculeatus]|uniref:dual specificity protein phosphatase 13B-like n=1 Tax=Syngnathoides biaculeatus TaxID=300417 RepID=UPI002ADE6D6F|nr:dual specificity protein phosphatase 13B-like [Syngnathoides biaculeatus]
MSSSPFARVATKRPRVEKAKVAHPEPESPASYEAPPASQLQRLMWAKKGSRYNHMDQVWPRIYLGDMYAAKDKRSLQAHAISHVLNAAHGKFNVRTGAGFYRDIKLAYHGVEAYDMVTFNLSASFYPAADFIRTALSSPAGRVLVHCAMGLSRSSSLVLAYLMIHEKMPLAAAVQAVGAERNIAPNAGFLEQLRALDVRLRRGRPNAWETPR